MTGVLDGDATFRYKLVGSPAPKIKWYRDSVMLDLDEAYIDVGDGFFTTKEIINSDAGMYQARASNQYGDSQMSLELLIASGKFQK